MRARPEWQVKREAHVMPEQIGTRWACTCDECDKCNQDLGRELEDALGKMLLADRALARTRSKRGSAKLSLGSNRAYVGGQKAGMPLELGMSAGDDSVSYTFDGPGRMSLRVPELPF